MRKNARKRRPYCGYWIYYAFDENKNALYIGKACYLRGRMIQHFRKSPWYPLARSFAFKQSKNRYTAQYDEYMAIQKFRPEYNVQLTCLYKGKYRELGV